jgi:hypothetical protein
MVYRSGSGARDDDTVGPQQPLSKNPMHARKPEGSSSESARRPYRDRRPTMRFPEIAVRSRRLKTQPGHHGSSGTLRHGPSGRTEFTPFHQPETAPAGFELRLGGDRPQYGIT